MIRPQPGWRVLDVGCGTGTGMASYVEAGCTVVGVDVSAAMLEKAKARLGNRAELHLTDGDTLPFESQTFDLVAISMALHEVTADERTKLVAEMARVTRPEGRLLFVDFRFGSLRGWRGPVFRALSVVIERFSGHYSGYRSFARCCGCCERNRPRNRAREDCRGRQRGSLCSGTEAIAWSLFQMDQQNDAVSLVRCQWPTAVVQSFVQPLS